jgi:signal transduction histidine kinase/putative methionine-R-sulfoxide reductase with GAF domain
VSSPEEERPQASYEERVRRLKQVVLQRERELAILSAVAAKVHGENEVGRILDIALAEILERLQLKAAWIFIGDDADKKLHLAASKGVSPAYIEHVRVNGLEDCLCPEVFWSGHRMVARNTTQCPRMPMIVDGLAQPVAHACIPLKFHGGSRGVLNVAAHPGEQFSEEELRFLETLGHQIGLAVERAHHLLAERVRNQEARAMAAISKAVGGSLDAAAVLSAVGDTARQLLGAERVAIYLGSDPRDLRVAHLSGLPHPELKEGQALDLVALGASAQIEAFGERRAMRVDDWERDPRVNQELARRWGAACGILCPLTARRWTLGLLVLSRTTPYTWSQEQVDVVEALAAQASVALENARLYEEARQAYRKLKDAQERMIHSETMAALGTFASGLAHEVRNPLNSMALQLSILERRIGRLEPGMAGEMSDLTAVIREEIRRLDGLVGDFLLFSRTSRIQHELTDVEVLMDEVIRLLRPEAREADVTLRRQRCGEPMPSLHVDAEKMKQVVINLVRNAIEAMPGGGVVVAESGVVDGQARIAVRDTGPGLPEGIDVFQFFVTTKPKGTGLGLSIVQQIVLQHGGEITATSEPGKGAQFVVTLPLAPAEDVYEKGALS